MTTDELRAIKDRFANTKIDTWEDDYQLKLFVNDVVFTAYADTMRETEQVLSPAADAVKKMGTDISALVAEVERLTQENEKMQCCGNCACYRFEVTQETIKKHNAYVGNKLVTFIVAEEPAPEKICFKVDGSGRCDKWEAADNG